MIWKLFKLYVKVIDIRLTSKTQLIKILEEETMNELTGFKIGLAGCATWGFVTTG